MATLNSSICQKNNKPVLLEFAVQPTGKPPNYLLTDDPDRANYMPVVWQQGEPLHITANLEEFQNSFSLDQLSEINKALLELRDIKRQAYQTNLKGKHWEIEDGSELLEMEKAVLQYQTQLIEFANKTEVLLPAMVALRWVSPKNDYERIPEYLVSQCNNWKEKQPEHPWVQQLCEKSKPSNLPVLIGDVFPDLQFPMLTNDTLVLKDN
jgi:hypothetical protein